MNSSWIEEANVDHMELDAEEEIFNQFDVILSRVPASHINEINVAGVIFIFKKQDSYFVEWKPNENVEIAGAEIAEDAIDEWSIINQITFKPAETNGSISFLSPKVKNLRIPLSEVRQFKVQGPELLLYNRSDQHLVTYNFKRSTAASLLRVLQNLRLLKQSGDRYIVKDPEFEKLQKSFAELNIDEIKTSNAPHRPLLVHGYEILSQIGKNVLGRNERYYQDSRPGAYRFEIGRETIDSGELSPEYNIASQIEPKKAIVEKSKLPPRQAMKRDNPLTNTQWSEFMTPEGKISDPERIREIIFHGGIEPSLRAEVWKFLLNYDLWEHSTEERTDRRKNLEAEYYRMKSQWSTLSVNQEKNHSGYRDRKCQIEKDVKRTDRYLDFYTGDDNPNIDRLQAILLTYVMYNFDMGYVQGMSDLLSPILYLIDDEAASFWCFVGFMEKVFRNFDEDQAGMKNQLSKLRTLMEFANPVLFNYLKTHESDNMYFCFRWLLVWFKREFTHDDILELWEVLWTSLPCANFHLLIGISILDNEMTTIIDNDYGFTEILKHVNDLSEKMDLRRILESAEAIYHQIINASKLPDRVRIIVGLESVKEYGDDPYDTDEEEKAQIARERDQKMHAEVEQSRVIETDCDSALEQNFF